MTFFGWSFLTLIARNSKNLRSPNNNLSSRWFSQKSEIAFVLFDGGKEIVQTCLRRLMMSQFYQAMVIHRENLLSDLENGSAGRTMLNGFEKRSNARINLIIFTFLSICAVWSLPQSCHNIMFHYHSLIDLQRSQEPDLRECEEYY